MAIKLENGKYKCSYCYKVYANPFKADACRETHDLVYVQLSKAEINKLIHFLYFQDDAYLDEGTIRRLKRAVGAYAG